MRSVLLLMTFISEVATLIWLEGDLLYLIREETKMNRRLEIKKFSTQQSRALFMQLGENETAPPIPSFLFFMPFISREFLIFCQKAFPCCII